MASSRGGEDMVLSVARCMVFALVAAVLALSSAPGAAHKDHDRQDRAAKTATEQGQPPLAPMPGAMHHTMEGHAEAMGEQASETFPARLMNWVGRTHPFAVHFPIALFPVALVALILARRRSEPIELIRTLIIVAGAASVIAAVLGWLTGGFVLTDPDAVHFWHRWIGTGLAVLGGAVAVWAFRERDSVNRPGMVAALAAITLLLLVQGWLGAALVHGMDHMRF
jgi:uncharacterized membrane protein